MFSTENEQPSGAQEEPADTGNSGSTTDVAQPADTQCQTHERTGPEEEEYLARKSKIS